MIRSYPCREYSLHGYILGLDLDQPATTPTTQMRFGHPSHGGSLSIREMGRLPTVTVLWVENGNLSPDWKLSACKFG